jgi:Glycosyl transferase family 2
MPDPRLTVICHFRNEEVYLPFWLRHHSRLFDHGVMIDYASTDHSCGIIRDMAPAWEIRPSRNKKFHSVSIDREVMDIENELSGWKMCLNVTEFIMHHDLRQFVTEFERIHPASLGLVTTGFIIQDSPDQFEVSLTDAELWEQRHYGCPEPDPFHNVTDRRRLLHKASHGAYGIGRHSNSVSMIADPPLYLFWYGWCPLELKMRRNKSTAPMVPSSDWGSHHVISDERVMDTWKTKYLPRCSDLLAGQWPKLNEAVERIRRSRV